MVASWILCGLLWGAAPAATSIDVEEVASLFELVLDVDEDTAVACLDQVIQRGLSGELERASWDALRQRLAPSLDPVWKTSSGKLQDAALQVAVLWRDEAAARKARALVTDPAADATRRATLMKALAATRDRELLATIRPLLEDPQLNPVLQSAALAALARYDTDEAGDQLIAAYPDLAPALQAQAITLLTQRANWSRQLVAAVQREQIPATAVGSSHLQSLMASRDPSLVELVKKQWGTVRTERNPQREQVLQQMKQQLARARGDAVRGEMIFQKVCGQCHKIHGVGQEVGPDITRNGRSHYDQLLSNVFDPSLVIGPAYQAVNVVTVDGRVLTGLLAEDSEQRVVLKTQGGKLEIVPRGDVEEQVPSQLSLMPENLEQQLQPQELADLFAFLTFDKHPREPDAEKIPGTPEG